LRVLKTDDFDDNQAIPDDFDADVVSTLCHLRKQFALVGGNIC
jgi:hypothetical protein